ncbi:MAG TPA: type I methionyl aminopeptidase, partial [Arthrobacter sp.]
MPSLASTAPIGTLTPGTIGPQRPVPASIPRP